MNDNKIERLKETIKSKRGKEIGSGYFRHVENEPNILEIDVCDVLDALAPYEIDYWENEDEDYTLNDYLETECEELSADNTYNWGAPVSNHINFEIFRNDDFDYIVRVMVHMNCSDIRCGYSYYMYFKFDYEEQFFETIIEDTNKYISIEVEKDGEALEYDVIVGVFYEDVIIRGIDGWDLDWNDKGEVLRLAWEQNAFEQYEF